MKSYEKVRVRESPDDDIHPMNRETPRVYIAATRQNDGKTTTSLGLLAELRKRFPRVGYIKPVGQRFVEIQSRKIDEDTVLMDSVYRLDCPLEEMSPIAVDSSFTRRYLENADRSSIVRRAVQAFDRVAWERDFVLCEGSGHAGVGAVFDFSNARAARALDSKVVLVSRGGIGKPIDEIALNQALFEKEGVEIIGVIINKVLPERLEDIERITRIGLRRRGLELLGVLPHEPLLSRPSVSLIAGEVDGLELNRSGRLDNLVDNVVVASMSADRMARFFRKGSLVISQGDRTDIVQELATSLMGQSEGGISGIILTGGLLPSDSVMDAIRELPFPVIATERESFAVSSTVHDLTVKTRPSDRQKIETIRELVAQYIDVDRIIASL